MTFISSSPILRLGKNKLFSLLAFFVITSGYSNAPGFIHGAITLPILPTFIIIAIGFIFFYKNISQDLLLFFLIALCLVSVSLSFFLTDAASFKTLSYSLAHSWFVFFIGALFLIVHIDSFVVRQRWILLALVPTIIYIPFEAFLPFFGVDIGSYIPRIERSDYEINSGFGFYRVRGFNYESAYLAMYLNVIFSILMANANKFKPEILLFWVFSLILTASLFQMAMFVVIKTFILIYFLYIFLKKKTYVKILSIISDSLSSPSLRFLFWYLLLATLLMVVFSNLAYWLSWIKALMLWYQDNLTVNSSSSIARMNNLWLAVNMIKEGWPWGLGMGAVQDLGYKGLTSFYLALVVQLGILSLPFFALILYLFWQTVQTRNIWLVAAFIFAFAHLLIIDVFYLPQVFLPILFTFIALRQLKKQSA